MPYVFALQDSYRVIQISDCHLLAEPDCWFYGVQPYRQLEALVSQLHQNQPDALILTGGDADTSVRVVVRPSGTEPKVKSYIEVRRSGDLRRARAEAEELRDELVALAQQW